MSNSTTGNQNNQANSKIIRSWLIIVVVLAVCVFVSDDIQEVLLKDDCHESNIQHKNQSLTRDPASTLISSECMPWLVHPTGPNATQKKIVFVALQSFDLYSQSSSSSARGEDYMAASMDWAAAQLGFEVQRFTSVQEYNQVYDTLQKATTIHRLVVGDFKTITRLNSFQWKETKCRIRSLQFSAPPPSEGGQLLHRKQTLISYPSSAATSITTHGSFIGFFVHEMITRNTVSVPATAEATAPRNRTGLIFGNLEEYQNTGTHTIIETLLQAGYTLHTLCTDCNSTHLEDTISRRGLLHHGWLTPSDRLDLITESVFMLGLGQLSYPLPIIGFTVGTAFLNPTSSEADISQHNPVVQRLGPPYVYHFNSTNQTQVTMAAQMAMENYFPSFVPYEYRPEAMLARMCSMLEDQSTCLNAEEGSPFDAITAPDATIETIEGTDNLSDNPSTAPSNGKPICAPWIKGRSRKVMFIGLPSYERFLMPGGSKSGENYVGASMDWAVQRLGFEVEHVEVFVNFNKKYKFHGARMFRRIIWNGVDHVTQIEHGKSQDIRCRFRPIDFFNGAKNYARNFDLHPKQILQPYPSVHGTFVGYFIHELLTESGPTEVVHKHNKTGFILGKSLEYFERSDVQIAISALLRAGFTLHSTCSECKDKNFFTETFGTNNSGTIIAHTLLSPSDYRNLLRDCAFMLGLRDPAVSPSPLIGFSVGTSFLNPIIGSDGRTQHDPISRLEAPYVYRVNLSNEDEVIKAAQSAVDNGFPAFVPYEYRPEAMLARMCAILEDDSICTASDRTNSSLEIRAVD